MCYVQLSILVVGLAIQKISAVPTVLEQSCSDATFPVNLDGYQISGLNPIYNTTNAEECRDACCNLGASCIMYQWSAHPPEMPECWVGPHGPVVNTGNYTTRARNPPAPAPPQPSVATALTIDIEDTSEIVRPELYGHDLEFTRHDLFNGISAEIIGNRKFGMPSRCTTNKTYPYPYDCWPLAVQKEIASGFVPRWKKIGSAALAPPWYGKTVSNMITGDSGHSIQCRVLQANQKCGVSQSGSMEGFDSENNFGSSIVLRHGSLYSLRLVMRRGSAATVIHVQLVDASGHAVHAINLQSEIPTQWKTFVSNFTVTTKSTVNATLSIWSSGKANWDLGTLSLTEVNNTWRGMRKDVVAALKQTGFKGLFRYPGGCYAPFYRWKIGLLHPDQRPPIETPPAYCAAVAGGVNAYTDGFMENGIGIDDFMALCAEVDMVAALTIRFQFGGAGEVQEAADWVEYVNGGASTTWGALRAERGHAKPFDISYWYLGNEINQQFRYPGYPDDLTVMNPPNTTEYAAMLTRMVPPLLAKSPSVALKFLVVSANPVWDHVWASEVGKNVYAASNHQGYYDQPVDGAWTWNEVTVTDCAKRPQREFVPILRDMRTELDATGEQIVISADEWGLGPPWSTQNFSVTHGIYAAGFLGAVTRVAAEVQLRHTNYFEPINEGALQVEPFGVDITPVGQVMSLYSQHQNGLRIVLPLVADEGGDLDIVATLHKDSKASNKFIVLLTVANLNAVGWFEYNISFTLKGCGSGGSVSMTTLKAQGYTESSLFDVIHSTETVAKGGVVKVDCPPFSVVHSSITC